MKRPRMRKRTLLMVLLLTGGAIINVAVAWGCLFVHPARPMHHGRSVGVTWTWNEGPSAGLPSRSLQWTRSENYADNPQRLLWPGFAINTVFYAAILWLLFAAPGLVRRRIRARRGQCPACAYPIGAIDVCTECGKPVPKRLGA